MTDMSWMPWVVGGVMVLSFLYMKVWPFVRTIIRAFRGPRFKSKSKLSVEQYKKLSIGSLYALQQGGYLNTLSLDIKDKLPTILGEWWGINNAHDARETLDDLCRIRKRGGKEFAVSQYPAVYLRGSREINGRKQGRHNVLHSLRLPFLKVRHAASENEVDHYKSNEYWYYILRKLHIVLKTYIRYKRTAKQHKHKPAEYKKINCNTSCSYHLSPAIYP